MTEETLSLEAQHAALGEQIERKNAVAATAAHFTDSEGKDITNPDALNDGVLRATGIAMEKNVKTIGGWKDKAVADVEASMHKALDAKDYVSVALHAAVLHAKQAIGSTPAQTTNEA